MGDAAEDADRLSSQIMFLVAQGVGSLIAAQQRNHLGHLGDRLDVRAFQRSLNDGDIPWLFGIDGIGFLVVETVAELYQLADVFEDDQGKAAEFT